jgi:hypothetical protein
VEHLTFKDYLVSKVQLKAALHETPFKIAKYRITKYCKLELAEGEEMVSLKPNNELIVEWMYTDIENPTIETVVLMTKESNSAITVKRDGVKLAKWLNSNAEIVD